MLSFSVLEETLTFIFWWGWKPRHRMPNWHFRLNGQFHYHPLWSYAVIIEVCLCKTQPLFQLQSMSQIMEERRLRRGLTLAKEGAGGGVKIHFRSNSFHWFIAAVTQSYY